MTAIINSFKTLKTVKVIFFIFVKKKCARMLGWHPTALNAVFFGSDKSITKIEHILRSDRLTVSGSFKFGVLGNYYRELYSEICQSFLKSFPAASESARRFLSCTDQASCQPDT